MSRAFVKEDAGVPDEDPPERPLSPNPNYVTPRGLRLLQDEEERLLAALKPLAGAQADPARKKAKREHERDLRYVRARLESAIPVDPAAAPPAELRFGARAVLRSDGGEERRVALVGEDEAEGGAHGGFELIPYSAPFANALLGLKTGAAAEWNGERWTLAELHYR